MRPTRGRFKNVARLRPAISNLSLFRGDLRCCSNRWQMVDRRANTFTLILFLLVLISGLNPVRSETPSQESLFANLTIRETTLGCPEVKFRIPSLPEGRRVQKMTLLRSTSDLAKENTVTVAPVARLPLHEKQTAFMDTLSPQDVRLFYQLEVQTDQNDILRSEVQSTLLSAPRVPELREPMLLVDKLHFTLQLLENGRVWRRFPIALGSGALTRRLHAEGGGTPEGVYQLAAPEQDGEEALIVDYPNTVDQVRYNFYLQQGLLPYPPPPIGGDLKIHGGGIETNWTWGTIALRDEDLQWLQHRQDLKKGTEIRISGSELRPVDLSLRSNLREGDLLKVREILKRDGFLTGDEMEDWYRAVNLYQLKMGLPITGMLDHVTFAHLMKSEEEKYGFQATPPPT